MSSPRDARLPLFDAVPAAVAADTTVTPEVPTDAAARAFAVDPQHNVVLEASAGTGKTSVLVARYVNLLRAGVDPANILAITFTRKAAAEMRERIVTELREAAARSEVDRSRWHELRERLSDVAISTIDAFCLSLLREFPLEADLDPGFTVADETDVPRLVQEALDRTLRVAMELAEGDSDIALLLTQLGTSRLREGLATLIDRRLVAPAALARFLESAPAHVTAGDIAADAVARLRLVLQGVPGGLPRFLEAGPRDDGRFRQLAHDLLHADRAARTAGRDAGATRDAAAGRDAGATKDAAAGTDAGATRGSGGAMRSLLDRARDYFLTREGKPRTRLAHPRALFASADAYRIHRDGVAAVAPAVEALVHDFQRGLNMVLVRGVRRLFAISLDHYRRTLDAHAAVDFTESLVRAIELLQQMDEFSRSRYRLESRYHHVLVDEFQDTSRAQWELVSLLVRSWGEGAGLVHEAPVPPSIFIVGDRKQSIYRFRDAEVTVLEEAAALIGGLRRGPAPRRAISQSFRAIAPLLRLVNDLFDEVEKAPERSDAFRYDDADRFPIGPDGAVAASSKGQDSSAPVAGETALGLCLSTDVQHGAQTVAEEIARVLREETVRDRQTGLRRPARPGDIAILFRARESHREYERALQERGIPSYVYKGLGFFEADEVQDVAALIRFLARPTSNLRAAAFVRSRFVRLSDHGLALLGTDLASTLRRPGAALPLDVSGEDRHVLETLRVSLAAWLPLVDRLPPADVIDRVIDESAYLFELSSVRTAQARENLKKLRGLVRRIQNRGYATMERIADHLDRLSAGDESNATIDAGDAVNLMTAHAAKGLEFPIVFVVQLERGAGGADRPIRLASDDGCGGASVSVGPFQTETDEDERAREREETKRLLYVSLTRARDRLYLAATLRKGQFKPAIGGLGEVLPASLKQTISHAAQAPGETVTWTTTRGTSHNFRLCRAAAAGPNVGSGDHVHPGVPAEAPTDTLPPVDDFSRLDATVDLPRRTVTQIVDEKEGLPGGSGVGDGSIPSEALLGTLIHRLFQSSARGGEDLVALAARANRLLRPEERSGRSDMDDLVDRAVRAYVTLRVRDEVRQLLDSGTCHFELTYSQQEEDATGRPLIVRGVIDCLVLRDDGTATVIEFKSGAPHPHHEVQLQYYVRAAEALLPGRTVAGVLVYV